MPGQVKEVCHLNHIIFTEEEKERAGAVNLVEFLKCRGEELEPSGSEWRWKRHDSVTVRGNTWYRHSCKYGGSPIQFLQEFYDMTYVEAVTCLLGGGHHPVAQETRTVKCPAKNRKGFQLPEANHNMKRVLGYLTQKRYIDYGILIPFIQNRSIYEDKNRHNAVFVGFDSQGEARHAHVKGTYSKGEGFCLNVEGSDPAYGFGYIGEGARLYVFEAAIDLLSFLTLYPLKWQEQSYICLDGLSGHAMLQVLQGHAWIKEVILCLDHDPAGIEACYRLKEILGKEGYDKVSRLASRNKDWNEDLKEMHGMDPVPAREHPRLISFREMCVWLKGTVGTGDTDDTSMKKIGDAFHHMKLLMKRKEMYQEGHGEEIQACLEEMSRAGFHLLWKSRWDEGPSCTKELLANQLFQSYQPHKDRGKIRMKSEELRKAVEDMEHVWTGYRSGECGAGQWRESCSRFIQACLKLHVQLTLMQEAQQMEAARSPRPMSQIPG